MFNAINAYFIAHNNCQPFALGPSLAELFTAAILSPVTEEGQMGICATPGLFPCKLGSPSQLGNSLSSISNSKFPTQLGLGI